MAAAFEEQLIQPATQSLLFNDRFGLVAVLYEPKFMRIKCRAVTVSWGAGRNVVKAWFQKTRTVGERGAGVPPSHAPFPILNAVRTELSWTNCRNLLRVEGVKTAIIQLLVNGKFGMAKFEVLR